MAFHGNLSIKDLFNGYVQLETAKVNARMAATAPTQRAGLNNPGRQQNPQAKTGQGRALPGGFSIKQAGVVLAGLALLGVVLKIAKVF